MKAVEIDDDRFRGRTTPFEIQGEVLDWFHELGHQPIDLPQQRVTLWADGVGSGQKPNTHATALLWYWASDRQSIEALFGQVSVTGLRADDGTPTSLDDATHRLLVEPAAYRYEITGYPFPISGGSQALWHFQDALGTLFRTARELNVSEVSFNKTTETITARVAR